MNIQIDDIVAYLNKVFKDNGFIFNAVKSGDRWFNLVPINDMFVNYIAFDYNIEIYIADLLINEFKVSVCSNNNHNIYRILNK